MFNWIKTFHDESAGAMGEGLSQEESDVALRLEMFKKQFRPKRGFFAFHPSPFAVRTLWNYQNELKYVAEAEWRRKKDLPAETFEEFLERKRPGNKYPLLLGTVILTLVVIFMVDTDYSRGHYYNQALMQLGCFSICVRAWL